MERIARAVPVKSKQALTDFLSEYQTRIDKGDSDPLFEGFGSGSERWYYQEIEGKPYIIAVTEGDAVTAGYDQYPHTEDEFFEWFSKSIGELSGIDLRQTPTGATSELVFEIVN